MKKFIDYNDNNGSINCIRFIHEEDKFLYDTDTTSLLEINDDANLDLRNIFISGVSIVNLPDIPITYDTLTYNISSTECISFSSIPVNTYVSIENEIVGEQTELVDDGILELNFYTPGIYTIIFDNKFYNNLTSTFKLTAI